MGLLPGGFQEYSVKEQRIFDMVESIIKKHYEKFGYDHIHTPAIESNKVLLAKSGNETNKQIFGLYGLGQMFALREELNKNEEENTAYIDRRLTGIQKGYEEVLKDYSLHFDLTIPFARYILDHENEITFPFKRFQIQPVRRGERQQRGRFKEFWQCDIDTVWRGDTKESMIFSDAEILILIGNILNDLKTTYFKHKGITIHYNNRKILEGLLGNEEKKEELFILFDKYYKIGGEKFELELKNISQNANKILSFIKDPMNNLHNIHNTQGIEEIKELQVYLKKMNTNNLKFIFDPFITRGLDYYTGTVYETFFDDDMDLGSISSGGRYDGLTKYIDSKRNFSGVGGSIGISRLISLIIEEDLTFSKASKTNFLCTNFTETSEESWTIINKFREDNEGNNVERYPIPNKDKSTQKKYAISKGIKYLIHIEDKENYIIEDLSGSKNQRTYKITEKIPKKEDLRENNLYIDITNERKQNQNSFSKKTKTLDK